jgi:hypothetical protein
VSAEVMTGILKAAINFQTFKHNLAYFIFNAEGNSNLRYLNRQSKTDLFFAMADFYEVKRLI